MNSMPYIIGAFCLGAALVWLSHDSKELEARQDALYRDMVCLHLADLRLGKSAVEARGWPNYKNIRVECER